MRYVDGFFHAFIEGLFVGSVAWVLLKCKEKGKKRRKMGAVSDLLECLS